MSKPRIVLHIFHRDLRTVDNAALAAAAAKASSTKSDLVTMFIFTPEQVGDANKYKSQNCIEFMLNSLDDLNEQLNGHLAVVYSTQLETLIDLEKKYTIVAITEQRDYTPFAKKRETETLFFATQHEIEYIVEEDLYLTNPGDVTNKQGRMFQKFTPFYDNAKTHSVPKPKGKVSLNRIHSKLAIKTTTLKAMRAKLIPKSNPLLHVKGGRSEALELLKSMPKDYTKDHDTPSISTSNLSAHNHFGTVSIREVYHALNNHEFRRQLYWRDFYGHITAFFEDLYDVSPYDFQKEHQAKWSYDKTKFNQWANGKTGHALVDAGMIQLKKTGYIHNRARLVAAIYLTKHLKIYWRWGEKHFAEHLVDYDFSQNFGNWCWCASVLPFSMATFRSLDPEVQLKKFDPDRKYVDQWLKAPTKSSD